jgi:hypothetical protein
MLGHVVLMAAMIGQTAGDDPRTGRVLSGWAKQAQARALAEFRANEHTIEHRLVVYYQLENQRLGDRARTMNVATGRAVFFAAGARSEYGAAGEAGRFSSVSPTENPTTSGRESQPSLTELQQENFLLKGHLRDSRSLYRQAGRLYGLEYPIRYELASWGAR